MLSWLVDIVSGSQRPEYEVTMWDNIINDPQAFFVSCLLIILILITLFAPAVILYRIYKKQLKKEQYDKDNQHKEWRKSLFFYLPNTHSSKV